MAKVMKRNARCLAQVRGHSARQGLNPRDRTSTFRARERGPAIRNETLNSDQRARATEAE
jgi:hypothetical protein